MEPARTTLLTEGRCRLVARTLMDLVKILMAGALASGFFAQFAWPVRLSMVTMSFVFFGLAVIVQPADVGSRKEL